MCVKKEKKSVFYKKPAGTPFALIIVRFQITKRSKMIGSAKAYARIAVSGLVLAGSLCAAEVTSSEIPMGAPINMGPAPMGMGGMSPGGLAPGDVVQEDPVIPNAPILAPTRVIEMAAVGMGVAPENTISPAQALALAKRSAIIDGYRQLGEKMYGIRINSKETVKDMVLRNSVIKSKVLAVIKNAEVTETVYKDGLCQVSMELKLDGRRWYGILSGRRF